RGRHQDQVHIDTVHDDLCVVRAQWYCIQVRADRLLDTGADHCRRDQPVTASVDEATEQSCLLSVGVEGKEGFDPPTSGVVGGTASTPESIEVPGKFDQGAA